VIHSFPYALAKSIAEVPFGTSTSAYRSSRSKSLHLDHKDGMKERSTLSGSEGLKSLVPNLNFFRPFPNPKTLIGAALTLAMATRVQAKIRVTLVIIFEVTSKSLNLS
jgi:hypothetical protein